MARIGSNAGYNEGHSHLNSKFGGLVWICIVLLGLGWVPELLEVQAGRLDLGHMRFPACFVYLLTVLVYQIVGIGLIYRLRRKALGLVFLVYAILCSALFPILRIALITLISGY